jgi:hypothetical protein
MVTQKQACMIQKKTQNSAIQAFFSLPSVQISEASTKTSFSCLEQERLTSNTTIAKI